MKCSPALHNDCHGQTRASLRPNAPCCPLAIHTLYPHDGADPDATLAGNERSSVATPASFLTQYLTQPCAPSLVNDTSAVRAAQTVPRRTVYTSFSFFPTALIVCGHTLSASELIK